MLVLHALTGKQFSVADAYLFVLTNWTKPTNIDLSPYKNLMAYHARVGARPAVQRVYPRIFDDSYVVNA